MHSSRCRAGVEVNESWSASWLAPDPEILGSCFNNPAPVGGDFDQYDHQRDYGAVYMKVFPEQIINEVDVEPGGDH